MNVHELETALKKHEPAPLYLVVGEEDCLRDQAVSAIRTAVLGAPDGEGMEAFNYDVLYGDESDASEILARTGQAPVFAARRFMVLKAADKLSARDGEALLPYLKEPCETTTLVFVAPKLDGRLKFTQALSKSAVSVNCGSLPEFQQAAWIRRAAEQAGVRLSEDAILLLKEVAGESLAFVQRELDKLAAYVPPGKVVEPSDVEAVRGAEPGASVFDLTAAIATHDHGRALRILARNIEVGEDPLRILGALAWQYRRIWKARELLRQGRKESELARLGIPPYKLRGFAGQLRHFSERHLRTAFHLFAEADSKLKGGSAGARTRVLESVLLALCAEADNSGARREPFDATQGREPVERAWPPVLSPRR